jgi:hypothetical protein
MGPKQRQILEQGYTTGAQGKNYPFSHQWHTTVLQAEVCIYAIKECIMKNINRNYNNRKIHYPLDSKAALKALDCFEINSRLVWKCLQSLLTLAEHNREQLLLVPAHSRVTGNEMPYIPAE